MGRFGVGEIIIIAVLVFVIFGGRKLPELGRSLGLALSNFRRGVREQETPSKEAEIPQALEREVEKSDSSENAS